MQKKNKAFLVHSLTDVGRKRRNNEDSFLYAELEGMGDTAYLIAVADGMGGHLAGEVASRRVVEVLEECVSSNFVKSMPSLLKWAITEANNSIYEMSRGISELRGMGSTCTAMILTDGMAYIAHVGDSRAYLVRENEVMKLTKDHTVAEQMVDCGIITPERARVCPERNFLLRAVGSGSEVEVDLIAPIDTGHGDVFVLCSDGLTEFVGEDEIGFIVNLYPPDEACQVLINIANERGGSDNITVQVVKNLENGKKTSTLKNLFLWLRKRIDAYRSHPQ